jgi:HEAT repeat protein
MNASFRSGLLAGFAAGAALTALAFLLFRRPVPVETRPSPPSAVDRTVELHDENRMLARPVEDPEKTRRPDAPAPAKEEAAKAEKPAPSDVSTLLGALVESGLAGFRSPKYSETLDAVKKGGKASIDYLTNILKGSASATERFYAAALLEGAGDAGALPGLAAALKGDSDDLVRRMASHAIAILGTPEALGPLKDAAVDDPDWGVRVNSAYGLAKLQNDEGLRILQDAYESPKTPAEYRLAVLGGLADVAAPSTAPLFRKILTDTQDVSYLLASIGALEKMKDTGALSALQQLAGLTSSDIVKQAAMKAIFTIQK